MINRIRVQPRGAWGVQLQRLCCPSPSSSRASIQRGVRVRTVYDEECSPFLVWSKLLQMETLVNDMTPEMLHEVASKVTDCGATNAWIVPANCIKNRSSQLLTIQCRPEDRNKVLRMIVKETNALSVTVRECSHALVPNKVVPVDTQYGSVPTKVALLGNDIMTVCPDVQRCGELAKQHDVAVKMVVDEAKLTFWSHLDDGVISMKMLVADMS